MRVMHGPKRCSAAGALGLAAAALLWVASPSAAAAAEDPFAAMDVQRAVRQVPAPAFRLRTLDDKALALEDLKGRVVAFYFWRTW